MKLIKNIKYWSSINHFERIQQYGFFIHLRYVFNLNVSNISINLQIDLRELPYLLVPDGYEMVKMNIADDAQINKWVGIVNSSYPDGKETYQSFKNMIENHSFLKNIEVFFLIHSNEKIGTVSIGQFKTNEKYGGDARIAILPTQRGKGLGLYLINFAFHTIKNRGLCYGESVISSKRTESLWLHFKLGFTPQFDRSKINFDIQKRLPIARKIAKKRVLRLYKKYLNKN